MIGITLDNPWKYKDIVATLKTLNKKIYVRVVFDTGVNLKEYTIPIQEISKYAYIVGQVCDSFAMPQLTAAQYLLRCRELKDLFYPYVTIWEIGNEINGDWLGTEVREKMLFASAVFSTEQKLITLYADEAQTYYPWILKNKDLLQQVQFIFISEYPQDNNGHKVDLNKFMLALAEFKCSVGYGECGTTVKAKKAATFDSYYTTIQSKMSLTTKWVGGYFWWYQKDFIPNGVLLSKLKSL